MGYFLNWGLMGYLVLQVCKFTYLASPAVPSNDHASQISIIFSMDTIRFSSNASVNSSGSCSLYSLKHSLVYCLFVIECAQTGLLTAGAVDKVVYHFGDSETMKQIYRPWCALPVMCAVVSMVVQGFFSWRIHRLSRLRILVGGIVLVSSIFVNSLCEDFDS